VRLQPAYSPDLAPCNFFLFQKVKLAVKGHHFESTENIQKAVTQVLNDVPQNAFQECHKEWQHRWKRFVQAQGMHFEGEYIVVDEYIKYNSFLEPVSLLYCRTSYISGYSNVFRGMRHYA
jgi:hypothetical protein